MAADRMERRKALPDLAERMETLNPKPCSLCEKLRRLRRLIDPGAKEGYDHQAEQISESRCQTLRMNDPDQCLADMYNPSLLICCPMKLFCQKRRHIDRNIAQAVLISYVLPGKDDAFLQIMGILSPEFCQRFMFSGSGRFYLLPVRDPCMVR